MSNKTKQEINFNFFFINIVVIVVFCVVLSFLCRFLNKKKILMKTITFRKMTKRKRKHIYDTDINPVLITRHNESHIWVNFIQVVITKSISFIGQVFLFSNK